MLFHIMPFSFMRDTGFICMHTCQIVSWVPTIQCTCACAAPIMRYWIVFNAKEWAKVEPKVLAAAQRSEIGFDGICLGTTSATSASRSTRWSYQRIYGHKEGRWAPKPLDLLLNTIRNAMRQFNQLLLYNHTCTSQNSVSNNYTS